MEQDSKRTFSLMYLYLMFAAYKQILTIAKLFSETNLMSTSMSLCFIAAYNSLLFRCLFASAVI